MTILALIEFAGRTITLTQDVITHSSGNKYIEVIRTTINEINYAYRYPIDETKISDEPQTGCSYHLYNGTLPSEDAFWTIVED